MKRDLQRKLEDAMKKAVDRREWTGRPFTLRDLVNDVRTDPAVITPEVYKEITIDRLTELIEDERVRTGVIPSTDRIKELLKFELTRLKRNQAQFEKELDEVFLHRVWGDDQLN
jgi:hypothetical protein